MHAHRQRSFTHILIISALALPRIKLIPQCPCPGHIWAIHVRAGLRPALFLKTRPLSEDPPSFCPISSQPHLPSFKPALAFPRIKLIPQCTCPSHIWAIHVRAGLRPALILQTRPLSSQCPHSAPYLPSPISSQPHLPSFKPALALPRIKLIPPCPHSAPYLPSPISSQCPPSAPSPFLVLDKTWRLCYKDAV